MSEDYPFEENKRPGDEPEDTSDGLSLDFGDVLAAEQLLGRFGLGATEKVETPDSAEALDAEAAVVLPDLEDATSELGAKEHGEESAAERWARLADLNATGDDKAMADERAWFVIHCYSGYEYKVKHNLEQRIESMGMQDFIYQVVVPTVEEIEIKDGKRRTVERCLFPGYIMVQMLLSDDSWYVVRNTPGVTGFVGMGNKPVPLRQEQVQGILRRMEAAAPQVRASFKSGQKVRIIEGPFADFIGVVDDIDEERTKLRVLVSFFGRETPVELDFLQVEKA